MESKSLDKEPDKSPVETKAGNLENASTLYKRVREILDSARARVARSVNTEMVEAYWRFSEAIVEQEQQGKERAGYGVLIKALGARLKAEGLKGFRRRNLQSSAAVTISCFSVIQF